MTRAKRMKSHELAIRQALHALGRRGYTTDEFHFRRGERIQATHPDGTTPARAGQDLDLRLEVRGGKSRERPGSLWVLAGPKPAEDRSELVVLVSLAESDGPRFYVLSTQEARERWDDDGRPFYWVRGGGLADLPAGENGFDKLLDRS